MNASTLASILTKLTTGQSAELAPDEADALPQAVQRGWVTKVTADTDAAAHMVRMRAELIQARSQGNTARESALREQILTLSDQVAESSGGVELTAMDEGGVYRASGRRLGSFHLTHKGRALLSDLGPRAARVGHLTVDEFEAALAQLKQRVDDRAGRARDIMASIRNVDSVGAARLAALGVASRNEAPTLVALYLEQAYAESGRLKASHAERWSSAESAVLAVSQLEYARPLMFDLINLQQSLFTQYAQGRTEDALDAAVMLLPWPEAERAAAIQRCATLANHFRAATNTGLPLAQALLIERTRPLDELVVARLTSMFRDLCARGVSPDEAVSTAALLSLSDGDASWLVARADELQSYLGRFSPTPLWAPAAALALLSADVPEILDDLRLASAATQRVMLATSGAEAIGLAIKLLLLVAALGHGQEGDPEESLVLRPTISGSAQRLGLAGLSTSLPMLVAATTSFHRPLLSAHEVALAAAPMHPSYVYGGSGWSSGWGSSGHYRGSRSWG